MKATRICPGDEKFGDDVALQNIALLGEGHYTTLILQLLTGRIDISSATVTADPDILGALTPPSTWQEMTCALLDLLMPADSIDNCARQIASFNQKGEETVASYAMRYRTLIGQFQSAVDRAADNRTTWSAMMVALWQHGLKASVCCLQLTDKPCTTMKEAIVRARRHEASGLAGGHVSALFNRVPHSALDRTPARPAPVQNRTNDKRSRDRASS